MQEKEIKGLTPEEVIKSREEYGENILTPPKKESVWRLFIEKFNDPIIKVLLVAALLSLIVGFIDGEFAETIGIFGAILLATGVSFWFEYDAKKRFEVLNKVNDDTPVKVIRSEGVTEIPKRDVVVGDIVVVGSGDEIPADGKLIEAISLKVNESTLTGEPQTSKTTDPEHFDKEATYPSNILLRGTTVSEGHAIIRVYAIGDATEYGKVAEQATTVSEEATPLNKQLTKLSAIISKIGGSLAVVIFIILLLKGMFITHELSSGDWLHVVNCLLSYFMVSVAIMVMAIPEGLPMSITLSLAMNMRRMLKTNNLVRKMHASETMGAVTVICTDKTGTLTRNEMRVHEMIRYDQGSDSLLDESIAMNSTAFIGTDGKVIGNPTEGALLLWMKDRGVDYSALRDENRLLDQITFSTERKYMATLVKAADGKSNVLYVKGAPEIVKAMCSVNAELNDTIDRQLRAFQDKAMRTLAFAYLETGLGDAKDAIESEKLHLIGIVGISDPVRKDVPDAVKECLNAGIQVKIVTGDTTATAREIARQIGLWNDAVDTARNIITGVEFAEMTDEELLDRVQDIKIMARARPLDKQRLVRLLQQKGEVVAVTGDGTNDAPALNFAQVGLSMGTGTSVAKEASDITLLDDSFKSIATAVMWGRSLYKNIQRFVLFQLTVNFVALIVVFFGSIFGGELPLTVTQILWVNLIMDTFAAMALASLPPNPEVMKEKPRHENDFIINKPMIRSIFIVGFIMVVTLLGLLLHWGHNPTLYQLSSFFTLFVMMQFWNLFNAKAFGSHCSAFFKLGKSKLFLLVTMIIFVGQILITTFGDGVFRTTPLSFKDWILIIVSTALILITGEIICSYNNRRKRKAVQKA